MKYMNSTKAKTKTTKTKKVIPKSQGRSKHKVQNAFSEQQFSYNEAGELLFFGHNLPSVLLKQAAKAKQKHLPVYVYHAGQIEKRAQFLMHSLQQSLTQKISVHYAMKANFNLKILRLLKKQGLGIDVVSAGEMKIALQAGFSPSQVIFSGVGKTEPEIQSAIRQKIFQLNVESLPELERVGKLAGQMKTKIHVGLRMNPGVNPKTHPYIATGFRENKFGLDPAQLKEAALLFKKYKFLKYQGLGLHIGSQIFDFSALAEGIEKTLQLDQALQEQGLVSTVFDVGGGIGVDYSQDAADMDAKTLSDFTSVVKSKLAHCHKKICFEPGRFLISRGGALLTEVQYVKQTPYKRFIIVNTGMNHLLRPALYQAEHRILPLRQGSAEESQEQDLVDVVGPVCESSDVLARKRSLPKVQEGDWLAIADAGAYGYSMASHYNSFGLPEEIVI
jgi:diaminopimelate decarboxylase